MQQEREELSPRAKARQAPREPGVYLMRDSGGVIIYVGKAKDLRARLASYFRSGARHTPKVAALVAAIANLEWHTVRNETESLLLEGRLIKRWKPRWNVLLRDDKQFLQIRVDVADAIPSFRLVRARTTETARYFGPFPHPTQVRRTLGELKKLFGIILSDAEPTRLEDGRWRLYSDARSEIQGHPNEVTEEDYRERVNKACEFLDGKIRDWAKALEAEMVTAAEARDYERAGECRDLLSAIRLTTEKARRFLRDNPLPKSDGSIGLTALGQALGISTPLRHIECFDISHISGTLAVASMIRFVNGQPDKSGYRRFRIKTFEGNDDFRSMHEVVGRRYGRLINEARSLPDLVVIDGGIGQVEAARKAFTETGIPMPTMIGLAKRDETIVRVDGSELLLPRHHEALRLLQRIRDEAHRFANDFNAELRTKKLRESLLDEIPGLGESRKAALLKEFGSIQGLRKATVAELTAVAGVGPQLAQRIAERLSPKS